MKKITTFTFCLLVSSILCIAQKLPKKQETAVWAPGNIKIDGKTDDWSNQFKAYNTGAAIFYTVANDDQNLYLIVQSKEPDVIATITGYGFELTLQKSDSKTDKNKITVSYPVFEHIAGNKPYTLTVPGQADTSLKQRETFANSRNAMLIGKFKTIGTSGIQGLDTVSIYNEHGLKAASRFDENYTYTIELAVPLKYLKSIISDNQPFFYNVSINGFYSNAEPRSSNPDYMAGWNAANAKFITKYSHSDFWGKYTLAKK